MVDAETEGDVRVVSAARVREEEDKALGWKFHSKVLSRKIWHAVRWATDRRGGGVTRSG